MANWPNKTIPDFTDDELAVAIEQHQGTHVTIRSVDHLPGKHQRLIGRQGIVGDHEGGMNIVTATGSTIGGYYAFPDNALTVDGHGSAPEMPRRYRVRDYYTQEG